MWFDVERESVSSNAESFAAAGFSDWQYSALFLTTAAALKIAVKHLTLLSTKKSRMYFATSAYIGRRSPQVCFRKYQMIQTIYSPRATRRILKVSVPAA